MEESTAIETKKERKTHTYDLAKGYKTNKPTKLFPSTINDKVSEYLSYSHEVKNLPTIEGFSLWIGCNAAYLSDKSGKNKIIAKAMARIKGLQKDKLVNNGLNRSYDSSMSKFLLMNNHGMSEKSTSINENINVEVNKFSPEDVEWKKTVINGQVIE